MRLRCDHRSSCLRPPVSSQVPSAPISNASHHGRRADTHGPKSYTPAIGPEHELPKLLDDRRKAVFRQFDRSFVKLIGGARAVLSEVPLGVVCALPDSTDVLVGAHGTTTFQ
jgi:hypothetical protein